MRLYLSVWSGSSLLHGQPKTTTFRSSTIHLSLYLLVSPFLSILPSLSLCLSVQCPLLLFPSLSPSFFLSSTESLSLSLSLALILPHSLSPAFSLYLSLSWLSTGQPTGHSWCNASTIRLTKWNLADMPSSPTNLIPVLSKQQRSFPPVKHQVWGGA